MKSWALCLVALLVPAAPSSPRQTVSPAFEASGAFFALSVADLDASARWYTEKLGLEVVMDPPPHQGTRVRVLRGGGLTVELMQVSGATPGPANAMTVHGIVKTGLSVRDLDATLAALRARNVAIALGPFPSTAAQPANFAVRDNAGNLLQFFETR